MSSDSSLPPLPQPSRGYRFATIGFGILLTALMVLFIVKQVKWTFQIVQPVEAYANYLNHHGAKTGDVQAPTHAVQSTPGQSYELDVDGKPVWITYFDTGNEVQIRAEKAIRESKTVEVDGKPLAAKVHGSLVLTGYEGHPDEAKLLDALDNFDK
jgi:hypothetical protein